MKTVFSKRTLENMKPIRFIFLTIYGNSIKHLILPIKHLILLWFSWCRLLSMLEPYGRVGLSLINQRRSLNFIYCGEMILIQQKTRGKDWVIFLHPNQNCRVNHWLFLQNKWGKCIVFEKNLVDCFLDVKFHLYCNFFWVNSPVLNIADNFHFQAMKNHIIHLWNTSLPKRKLILTSWCMRKTVPSLSQKGVYCF